MLEKWLTCFDPSTWLGAGSLDCAFSPEPFDELRTGLSQHERKIIRDSQPPPFALSPSISRPFVLSFVEGNGLLLRTGVSKGERKVFSTLDLEVASSGDEDVASGQHIGLIACKKGDSPGHIFRVKVFL